MNDGIGNHIREVRLAKGMSLRAAASAIGISPSLLSQVETGKSRPSVSTLYAIVTFLGLSIDSLIGGPGSASPQAVPVDPVQRREDAPTVVMENGVTWERLAAGGRAVDPILTTYAAHGSSSLDQTHMRHSGIEYGYIIRGELTLRLEFESYRLRTGDSVCFDSTRPHLYINHTNEVTQGLWFVVGYASDPEHQAAEGSSEVSSAVDVLDIIGKVPYTI